MHRYLIRTLVSLALFAGTVLAFPQQAQAVAVVDESQIWLQYLLTNQPTNSGPPSYVPNQYILVSSTPDFSFSVRHRGFVYDTGVPSAGARTNVETYQLTDLVGGSGNRRDVRNAFPTPQSGATVSVSGSADPQLPRFNSTAFPQYNGYYVFLIKIVDSDDQNHGYITGYTGLNSTNACAAPKASGGTVTCPALVSNPFIVSSIFSVQYNITAPDQYQLATAPSNLATAFSCGTECPPGSTGLTRNPRVRFTTAGAACRLDWQQAGTPYMANADFDDTAAPGWPPANGSVGVIQLGSGQPEEAFADSGAFSVLSRSWRDGVWAGSLSRPGALANSSPQSAYTPGWQGSPKGSFNWGESSVGQIHLSNMFDRNLIWMGSVQFTSGGSGTLPNCNTSPFAFIDTPRNGYAYNGGNYNPDSYALRYRVRMGSFSRPFIKYQVYSNNQPVTLPGWSTRSGSTYTWTGHTTLDQFTDLGARLFSNWEVCVTDISASNNPRDGSWACTGPTGYYVNVGPTTTKVPPSPGSPPGKARVNYLCDGHVQPGADYMNIETVDVFEDHHQRPTIYLSWNKPGVGSGSTQTNPGPLSRDMPGSAKRIQNFFGNNRTVTTYNSDNLVERSTGKTLTRYLAENIPDGSDVTWRARSYDTFVGADKVPWNNLDPEVSGSSGPDLNQYGTGYRWGPDTGNTTYHKNSRPSFATTTKEFYDLNGNKISNGNITDGQTVRTKLTIKNSGETPAHFYEVKDYFGQLRDFEKPLSNQFTIKVNANPEARINLGQYPNLLKAVVPGTRTNPDTDQVLNETNQSAADYAFSSNNSTAGAWRLDFGSSESGVLKDHNAPAELTNTDTIVITYTLRANRNYTIINQPSDPNANYARRQQVGDRLSTVTAGDTHTWIRYQEDYCNPADRKIQTPDVKVGDVLAPWLRGGRGSIHANVGIAGYDPLAGEFNATFIVTTGGTLSHFSGKEQSIQSYVGGQQQYCGPGGSSAGETVGGVDWRRAMIKNIIGLKAATHNVINSDNFNDANQNLNGPNGNVWEYNPPSGTMTISGLPKQFAGTGTIIVNGNINIKTNMSYVSDAAGINSLGIIALGNISIAGDPTSGGDPAVTAMVGSYFALDSDAALDAAGCPRNISRSKGQITTGVSGQQLNVNGLMVASSFSMQRYYVSGEAEATGIIDPAENIYYDGRVVTNTPPGFGAFRNTAAWYEIVP